MHPACHALSMRAQVAVAGPSRWRCYYLTAAMAVQSPGTLAL